MTPSPDPWLTSALGNPPFPWQARLLDDLVAGRLPGALDLPTGLGKTSVMAIWLVARARGAELPRRLVYVVDRRAVVDQATAEAERLRDWAAAEEIGVALGLGARALPISTLRGQFVDNRSWLEDPSSPAIVVGTVDMVGSRLLFEGYATSRKMRPFHAGLLGADAWFVLDESHLVPPFAHLLQVVCEDPRLRGEAGRSRLLPIPRWLGLSATGQGRRQSTFRLDEADLAHPVVRRRVEATKHAKVVDLGKRGLAEALAEEAWTLAMACDEPSRVLVFATRRDDAERAQRHLLRVARDARGRQSAAPGTCLFVGGRRVRERAVAAEQLRALGFVAGSPPPADHSFVFATSAGEVGVDLDAVHAVMDAVAWERMVQRLGRVNRRGSHPATVVIVPDPESPWARPVIGLLDLLPVDPDGRIDASPAALMELRREHEGAVEAASTASPAYPELQPATLEAWAMTSLLDHPGRPEVRPWLRGWVDDPPRTSVVWRTRLPPPDAAERTVVEYFEAAPAHLSERLDVETFKAVKWLGQRSRAVDLEEDEIVGWVLDESGRVSVRWTVADLRRANSGGLQHALSGRSVFVDARIGGLSVEGLLDPKESVAPLTGEVGDPSWIAVTDGGAPAVTFRVRERANDEVAFPPWYARLRIPLARSTDDEEVCHWLVVEQWRSESTTEDDRSSGPPQLLDEHHAWTAERAERLAVRVGLPDDLRRVVVFAASLHDGGKRAARWQRAFHAPTDGVYAKTRGPVDVRRLDGYRHELGSVLQVERDSQFAQLRPEDQDLVLHLVAAHHGFGRPTIPTRGCEEAPPSILQAKAEEIALRFVRLQSQWGPWGLAWLETLMRAADQMASRANHEREEP